ncbi:cation:proton antiporter [Virgibacillus kimchii]
MDSYQLLLMLTIGYIVYSIDKRQEFFPVPVILLILGLVLSFVPYFENIAISQDMLFFVFLPSVLFVSAYQFPVDILRKDKWIIGCLGTLGVLLNVFVLGAAIFTVGNLFMELSFIGSLLVASILAPTDPVSVVSILKKSLNNEKIADIVEGESLLNDGTSIVLFTVLLGMSINQTNFAPMLILGEFLAVSLGGTIIGLIFGWVMSKAVSYSTNRQYQVMLSIIVAYGSFYLGELFGVSGVLATVAAGMMLSFEFGRNIKDEEHFHRALDGFWEVVEPSVLSIMFLLIGILAMDYLFISEWLLIIIIFVLSLLARFIVLNGITQSIPTWKREFSIKDVGILSFSGIKGAVSVVLLLGLEATAQNADPLVSLAFGTVILSLIIQSIGIYPLSKL